VVQKPLISLDMPEYAVPDKNLIPVNDYPAHMQDIPPSRMFTIKLALDKYKEKAGKDAVVYDASQGDGGESLPGVPREILERALELQIEHGTGYDKPYGTDYFRKVTADTGSLPPVPVSVRRISSSRKGGAMVSSKPLKR
jgi:aspartate aminotransferase